MDMSARDEEHSARKDLRTLSPSAWPKRTALLCILLLVSISPSCLAWSLGHWKITRAALDTLPAWQRELWRDSYDDFRTYCLFPDMGLANPDVKPYLVVIGGRLFHYFPRDNRQDFAFFNDGAEQYVRQILAAMREERYVDAAKFAGALAHALEDAGQPQCHSLEGINGFPWAVLDELFTPEDQSWNRAPQSIISLDDDARFKVSLGDYRPKLLGTHPREVAFRLYQRTCQLRRGARKALPAMLRHVYAGDKEAAIKATVPPAVADAQLVADLFYTCFALTTDRYEPGEVATIETLDLTSLVPIAAPTYINHPYRFSPLAYGCCVNAKREPVPLEVWTTRDGGKQKVVLAKGIGTGCCRFSYMVPAGVFNEFRCTAGLHASLSSHPSGAKLNLTIRWNGKDAFSSGELLDGSLAQDVVIPVAEGGTLEFVSKGKPGSTANYANHAVWGNPVLARLVPTAESATPTTSAAVDTAPTASAEPLSENLLVNGSLEEWTEGGLPAGWRIHARKGKPKPVTRESTETHSGTASARCHVDDEGSIAALWTSFKNEPEKRYRLTFWWKSRVGIIQYAVKRVKKGGGWVAYNGRAWRPANSNPLAQGAPNTWTRTVVEFPAFEESMDMNIEICRPFAKGTGYDIYVDDVSLEEIPVR
mgnify:CR=1 FL=1|jgi:hypothetical protein